MKTAPRCHLVLFAYFAFASAATHAAVAPARREWTVGGVAREALVYVPQRATTQATPIIFAFHGHGGTARNAARNWAYETLWPEALVVYPQGLKTPGRLTDPEGLKSGWQSTIRDQDDRDLKFFDAMLASLRQAYRIDDHRVYSTGHSNGGGFTYLLWAQRVDQFAAFAPVAAVDAKSLPKLKPMPVFHVAGEKDPLVRFSWQKQMIESLRRARISGRRPAAHRHVFQAARAEVAHRRHPQAQRRTRSGDLILRPDHHQEPDPSAA
jgi:polyhydroxybutyrate depolymerase